MITIPEGMGLDAFGALGGRRKTIVGVKQANVANRKKRFVVPPGLIRSKYVRDRQWDYTAAREGEPPRRFRVAEVDIVERPTSQKYVRVTPANSIDMPGGERNVKVVGPNEIVPAGHDPDFVSPKGRVVVPTPEDIMAKDDVEVLPLVEEFVPEVFEEDVPGFDPDTSFWRNKPTGVIRQAFPAKSNMEAPDKLLYRNPSTERPSWRERHEVHEEYEKEGEEEMKMGTLRIPEDVPLEQFDVIASVAAAALTAGATGYKAYADIKAAKEAKKAASQQAAAQANASAAAFEQQFNQQTAARYGAPGQPLPPGYPPSFAPTSVGTDWTKIALYAGGGIVLVGVAYMLLKS